MPLGDGPVALASTKIISANATAPQIAHSAVMIINNIAVRFIWFPSYQANLETPLVVPEYRTSDNPILIIFIQPSEITGPKFAYAARFLMAGRAQNSDIVITFSIGLR
jgi:hypothetical protein